MELDEMKKLWQEIDQLKEKQQISTDKIKSMLKKSGKSALDELIRILKINFSIAIPAVIIFCYFSRIFFETDGYYFLYPLLILITCIIVTPFQIKQYRILKEIDFAKMSVVEVSAKILKYQNMIQKMQLFEIICVAIYLGFYLYLFYLLNCGYQIIWGLIIFNCAVWIGAVIMIPVLYKKWFFNRIKRIKESLKELKEFEEPNN